MRASIKPEKMYDFQNLSMKDLKEALKNNSTITVWAESASAKKEEIIVRLNDNLNGKISFEEATIYPFTYSSNPYRDLPKEIGCILNQPIRVKVLSIDESTSSVILSRKKNMEEAVEILKNSTWAVFYVTSIRLRDAFGDIGDGIYGRLYIKEVSCIAIKTISERIHKGDSFVVKLIGSKTPNKFDVSYKMSFPEYNMSCHKPGDTVYGIVGDPIDEKHDAYRVELSPQIRGILNLRSFDPHVKYGDKIICSVSNVTEQGLKLLLH